MGWMGDASLATHVHMKRGSFLHSTWQLIVGRRNLLDTSSSICCSELQLEVSKSAAIVDNSAIGNNTSKDQLLARYAYDRAHDVAANLKAAAA